MFVDFVFDLVESLQHYEYHAVIGQFGSVAEAVFVDLVLDLESFDYPAAGLAYSQLRRFQQDFVVAEVLFDLLHLVQMQHLLVVIVVDQQKHYSELLAEDSVL